jgi:hypothetical protein
MNSAEEEMTPQELAELEAQVEAMGHKYYGIFADDPGGMEVFDEIERLRDQHTFVEVYCPLNSALDT